MSLFLGTRFAWGGVGGGAWGSYDRTARPGSHFGYDDGWSFSSNGKVWLSASCNCTVGRMTELYLEIGVDAYVACGGIWNPTWLRDMPDTPTYAYIRDDAGTWLVSRYWIIDTDYDHDWYAHMVGASLRVSRRESDWRCWCGADIRGLGGSAPGTHSIAEAPQWIPHHALVDDRSWQGRIVSLHPRAAEHLCASVVVDDAGSGANVVGGLERHTTNQNWLVLSSAQGRTCFVPVHTGSSPLFLDVDGAMWDDGANVQIWAGNGSLAQSYYLHDLGDGYHLIIPECSGCAVDLSEGGQEEGTNIVQWNCFGDWNKPNQNWRVDEVEFREVVPGSLGVEGEPRKGNTLIADHPGKLCVPYDCPGTSGMFYRYGWYRGSSPGSRSQIVREAEEDPSYTIGEADEACYLTCVITAYTRYCDVGYRGEVVLPSIYVQSSHTTVRYFIDGEATPCFEENVERDTLHVVPETVWKIAEKPLCAGVDGWYRDSAYTRHYEGGFNEQESVDLYAFNRVDLSYKPTDRSFSQTVEHRYYLDRGLTVPFIEDEALPPGTRHRFGERVVFARGKTVWFEDMGWVREMPCASGAFANAQGSGAIMRSGRLSRNTTVYLDWIIPSYDGIALL